MYTEDSLLPLSGLQHLAFCERQWALIHIEGQWAESRATVEGGHLHDRVHETETEVRGNTRIARGLRLHSFRLGVVGQADAVEFERVDMGGVPLPGARGLWRPMPVEYKRGRPKRNDCDRVQLCAQAMCLEEMWDVDIGAGALFYGKTRRRMDVPLDAALRTRTETLARRMHALFDEGATPPAQYGKHCEQCSLMPLCMPKTATKAHSAAAYLHSAIREIGNEEDTP